MSTDNDQVSIDDKTSQQILSDAGLFAADPCSVSGLSEDKLEPLPLDHEYQIAYDTSKTTGEKVRCSFCSHRQHHYRGFIVRISSGEVGLLGIDCGERHYFGDGGWQELQNAHRRQAGKALFEHRWRPALQKAAAINQIFQSWMMAAADVTNLFNQFSDQFPELQRAISTSLSGGELKTARAVRNQDGDVSGHEYVTACRTEADWFFKGKRLENQIEVAKKKLENAASGLTTDLDWSEARLIAREFKETKRVAGDIARMQRQLAELTDDTLWKNLASWARSENIPPANYRFKHQRLRCSDNEFIYGDFAVPSIDLKQLSTLANRVLDDWPVL